MYIFYHDYTFHYRQLSRKINIVYDYVYVYTVCTHSYIKSIYTVSLPIQLICSVYLLAWGEPVLDQRAVIFYN